jgi:rubrerythrin
MALQPDFDLWSWFIIHMNETDLEIRSHSDAGDADKSICNKICFLRDVGNTWNNALRGYSREDWLFLNELYSLFVRGNNIIGYRKNRKLNPSPCPEKERMFRSLTSVLSSEFQQVEYTHCPSCGEILVFEENRNVCPKCNFKF